MNDTMFWRLVWKEYRVQRGLWMAALASCVVLDLIVISIEPAYPVFLLMIPTILVLFFAMGSGAIAFAAEVEDKTVEYLQMISVPPSRLFLSKLATTVVGVVSLFCAMWLVGWVLAATSAALSALPSRLSSNVDESNNGTQFKLDIASWFLTCLGIIAVSLLSSIFTRNVLKAICLAAVLTCFGLFLIHQALESAITWHLVVDDDLASGLTYGFCAAIIGTLLFVELKLARTWLKHAGFARPTFSWWPKFRHARTESTVINETAFTSTKWRLFGRLLWLEFRNAWLVFILVLVVVAGGLVVEYGGKASSHSDFGMLIGLVVTFSPLILGVWSFRGEQSSYQFRFLAERGASPATVWFSKHAVWLSATVVVVMMAWQVLPMLTIGLQEFWQTSVSFDVVDQQLVTAYQLNFGGITPSAYRGDMLTMISHGLLLVTMTYSIGQFVSMMIFRPITAGFIGMVLAVLAVCWMRLMTELAIPVWWSVAPIPVCLLLATFFRCRNWLCERNSVRTWVPIVFTLLIPTTLVAVGITGYRVWEIPDNGPGFSREEFLQSVTDEQHETAKIYKAAINALVEDKHVQVAQYNESTKSVRDDWKYATETEQHWLRENKSTLTLVRQASQRDSCAFMVSLSGFIAVQTALHLLKANAKLLLFSARKHEAEGDLDSALDDYISALRMARHMEPLAGFFQISVSLQIRRETYEWMMPWGVHPNQTAERLQMAIHQIEEIGGDLPPIDDAVKANNIEWHDLVESSGQSITQLFGDYSSGSQFVPNSLIERFLPSERVRAMRLFDLLTVHHLKATEAVLVRYRQSDAPMMSAFQVDDSKHLAELVKSTSMLRWWFGDEANSTLRHAIDIETQRRATLIRLALLAVHIEQGELPELLAELSGSYLERVPLDPWSSKPFYYFQDGLPQQSGSSGYRVRAHQPIVWSVGHWNPQVTTDYGLAFPVPQQHGRESE